MEAFLKCLRCFHGDTANGHHPWRRRTIGRLPVSCPKCHRTDWNKENVNTRPRTKSPILETLRKEPTPMTELHNIYCDCTSCLLARGLL